MAPTAAVTLAFATLIIFGMSTQMAMAEDTGLSAAATYDCDGAKQIATVPNACNLLCGCVGSLNKAYAGSAMKSFCISGCEACSAAAQKCTEPGMSLPSECQAGNGIKEVGTCITTFLAANGRGQ